MNCHFSPAGRRRVKKQHLPSPESSATQSSVPSSAGPELPPGISAVPLVESSRTLGEDTTHHADVSAEEEADVPREARLLCDARGKLSA